MKIKGQIPMQKKIEEFKVPNTLVPVPPLDEYLQYNGYVSNKNTLKKKAMSIEQMIEFLMQSQTKSDPNTQSVSQATRNFELVLLHMFDYAEKVGFLENVGFTIIDKKGKKWLTRTVSGHIEEGELVVYLDFLFYREIILKFKNVLLAKPVLKIKI